MPHTGDHYNPYVEDVNAIDDFGGAPYYLPTAPREVAIGSPDLMFNDPPPPGFGFTPSISGFAIDDEGYASYTGGDTGGNGSLGGGNDMADIDWNTVWGDASQLGGWGGALTAAAAIGGAGSTPSTGSAATTPSTGSGSFNIWDLGGLLLSGYQTYAASQAAKDAGQLQFQSTQEATDAVNRQFLIGKEGLDPFTEAGPPAVNRQLDILGLNGPEAQAAAQEAAYSGPGFEFRRDRIIGDINRGASAKGQLKSGNRLAALTDRLQGLYASQGNQYFSQLSDVSRTGLAGASATAGVSQNAGTAISANTVAGGTNLADAKLGSSEAYQSGVANIYGAARDRWGR